MCYGLAHDAEPRTLSIALSNTVATPRYTRTAMVLHWLVAVLIVANVALGLMADSLPDDWVRTAVDGHKSIGITVLGLAVLRLLWRFANPPPPMPDSYTRLERLGAHAAHWALYGLIFALPLSGWMHDSAWNGGASHPFFLYGAIPWFRIPALANLDPATKDHLHAVLFTWHVWFGYALYGLLALHILGALKHQVWDREAELQRMMS